MKYASKFRGIALDVFDKEPLDKYSELWDLENLIITPHNSWVSEQNHLRSFNLFYNNLKKYIYDSTYNLEDIHIEVSVDTKDITSINYNYLNLTYSLLYSNIRD